MTNKENKKHKEYREPSKDDYRLSNKTVITLVLIWVIVTVLAVAVYSYNYNKKCNSQTSEIKTQASSVIETTV